MTLAPGQSAPDFEATNWDGTPVRLADHRDRKVWLAFFRYASCPLCNLRVHDIIARHADLASRGVDVLAVFQSPPERIASYVGKQAPPFPILADPTEALYGKYGLRTSLLAYLHPKNFGVVFRAMRRGFLPGPPDGSATRVPGDFLIRPDGTLADAFYGKVIADHIPFERVEAFARG